MKQSIQDNVEGPISWHGSYTDFGDYETAVKRNCGEEGITFKFKIEKLPIISNDLYREKLIAGQKSLIEKRSEGNLEVNVLVKRFNDQVIKQETHIKLQKPNVHLYVKSGADGEAEYFKLNNNDKLILDKKFKLKFQEDYIFSKIRPEYSGDLQELNYEEFGLRNILALRLGNILREALSGQDVTLKEIESEALKILENVSLDSKTLLNLENNSSSQIIQSFYQTVRSENLELISELNEICGLFWAISLHNLSNVHFQYIMSELVYFRPTRGRDDRYFRRQKIEKMEILPEGENLSGFYESLDDKQMNKFSHWIKENFGFGVSIERNNGHTSINICEYGEVYNLADSGYGITETLPFLTQIWWELQESTNQNRDTNWTEKNIFMYKRRDFELPKLIAIEQPELHLHPAHQAKIADVLANAIKLGESEGVVNPNFVIETHSSSIINRLGQLIRRGEIREDDINVLVFSKRDKNSQVKVDIQKSHYDSEGILQNWPYGFFRYSK